MENRSDALLETKLDNNDYDEAQLVSIKVPVTQLAYYNSSATFERVDGQIQSGGITYKYVKRRLYDDTLEVLCIPDHTAMQLETAKNDFFKLVNDLQPGGQSKKTSPHKNFSKTFSTDSYAVYHSFTMSRSSVHVSNCFADYAANLLSSSARIGEQPPDVRS